MCGICGIVNLNKVDVSKDALQKMMNAMKHRGPDDEGIFVDSSLGLGFVRLSILDLSIAGHQPFISSDQRYTIVFNGEVYNYIEIRNELLKKGYSFKSNTDTEVVLNSFIEWGEECLLHFNGMFAFAIFDKSERTIKICRDRFGIKPLYFYQTKDTFIFASDIPSILATNKELAVVNDKIIFDYLLTNRTNHTNNTFFKDIKKLQHGHVISIQIDQQIISERRWYNLSENRSEGYKNSEEFKSDFIQSINYQLRSDVPVGLCLSGGLDSSSIGASISKLLNRSDIHSFSAVYGKGLKGDESEFIKEFDGYIDNIHFTHPTAESFMEEMDSFVTTISEPVPGTSEYAEYKVMQIAKNYCTVLLNGQGVDEYMAGYHYFIGFYYKQLIGELKWIQLANDIYKYYKIHKSYIPLSSAAFYMVPIPIKKMLLFKKLDYINSNFYEIYSKQHESDIVKQLYTSKNLKQSFIDHYEYKFEHHLLWADKSGMKFSLETRFPFLDHTIVERMLNTNSKHIYSKGVTKIILREAMKNILPEKIRTRMDKVGYETPEDMWFRTDSFKNFFYEIVHSTSFKSRPYFNVNKVIDLYHQHLNGSSFGREIWKIIHLELWLRKFIDSKN